MDIRKYIRQVLLEDHIKSGLNAVFTNNITVDKTYEELGGWFTGIIKPYKEFSVFAPSKQVDDMAYVMGGTAPTAYNIEGKSQKRIWYVKPDGTRKIIPWNYTDQEKMVKYIWLMTLKSNNPAPVKEEAGLRKFMRQVLQEEHYEPTVLHRIDEKAVIKNTYPDIDNWITAIPRNTRMFIQIYRPYANMPGYGYFMGHLVKREHLEGTRFEIIANGKDMLAYHDNDGVRKYVPWDFNDEKNAVRFVYLHSLKRDKKDGKAEPGTEPLNESIGMHRFVAAMTMGLAGDNNKPVITVDGMDNWRAQYVKDELARGSLVKIVIYDGDKYMGGIDTNGFVFVRIKKDDWPNFKYLKDKNIKFDTNDVQSIQKAMRTLYVKSMKAINEGYYVKQTVEIPGLPGWTAERIDQTKSGGNAWWSILNKGKYIGAIFDSGLFNVTNLNRIDDKRKDLAGKPIQAARQMFILMQKPKKKKITEAHIKVGTQIDIPGIKDWFAVRQRGGSWLIYRKNKPGATWYKTNSVMGHISDKGELDIIGFDGPVVEEKNRMDLANNPIKTARYLYVKHMTPLTSKK